jgi:hypothetical protein
MLLKHWFLKNLKFRKSFAASKFAGLFMLGSFKRYHITVTRLDRFKVDDYSDLLSVSTQIVPEGYRLGW